MQAHQGWEEVADCTARPALARAGANDKYTCRKEEPELGYALLRAGLPAFSALTPPLGNVMSYVPDGTTSLLSKFCIECSGPLLSVSVAVPAVPVPMIDLKSACLFSGPFVRPSSLHSVCAPEVVVSAFAGGLHGY